MIELNYDQILEASYRLNKRVLRTELVASPHFSEKLGVPVLLKCENLQKTGAFKLRGALNFMTARDRTDLAKGVTAASAGNHAQGVAFGADLLGIGARIFMPENTPPQKVQATKDLGAEVVLTGANYDESCEAAQEDSRKNGTVFIHPFDDPLVIAGQGTIGLEILKELPDVSNLLVPIGGGGLIAGVATAIKATNPQVRIIGVEAATAPSMQQAVQQGKPCTIPISQTIADGIAVKTAGNVTLPIIKELVDEIAVVEEEEIALAIVALLEKSKLLVEGAGAVTLAALLNNKVANLQGKTVCLLSGGNIDVRTLSVVVERALLAAGRYLRLRIQMEDMPGALARLTGDIAKAQANINLINHDRRTKGLGLGRTEVQLVLETRGQEHAAMVLGCLRGCGYRLEVD